MPQSLIGKSSASIVIAGVQAAERDLGRGDEIQIEVLDAVDLRLRPARDEADACQDLAAGQVGRDRRREAFLHQQVDRVLLQRQFQQHRFVLQEVEAVAGDARAAFEVDQVVLLAELRRGRAPGSRIGVTCVAPLRSSRLASSPPRGDSGCVRFGMLRVDGARLGVDALDVGLLRFLRFAELPAFFLAGFALGVVLRLADRLADDVGLPREFFDLLLQLAALRSRASRTGHVGLHAAAVAVLLNELGVLENEALIEHGGDAFCVSEIKFLTTKDAKDARRRN